MSAKYDDEERCEKHDMILSGCADCRGLGELVSESDVYEGLLIDRFYTSARHRQPCQLSFNGLQRHDIVPGEPFSMAVYDSKSHQPPFKKMGYVCGECTHRIADGVSVQ